MAKVVAKRRDGTAIVIASASDSAELEVGMAVDVRPIDAGANLPWPFGALRGKYPPFEAAEIKAARREAFAD